MLKRLYEVLSAEFGPLEGWWQAGSPFERIAGAILVQQTRWENVDRALAGMRRRGLMSPEAVDALPLEELEALVRPAGFYRNKARALKGVARYLVENPGALGLPAGELRGKLLGLRGIGDETADVLLLYVAGRPSFVIDAYTRRTLKCMGIEGNYRQLQELFHQSLPHDAGLFRHYHALLVEHGKRYCSRGACEQCAASKAKIDMAGNPLVAGRPRGKIFSVSGGQIDQYVGN